MTDTLTDEDLLDEIRRLSEVVDGTPSSNDMRKRGNHSVDIYQSRFGTWNEAVQRAGFEPNRSSERIPTETLISDIQRVADELDHPPSINEYREHGNHSIPTYMNRFGSWPETTARAGLEPGKPHPIPQEWLLGDLHALMDRVDGRPTTAQINSLGSYSDSTYRNRFGSISDAVDAAAAAFGSTEDEGNTTNCEEDGAGTDTNTRNSRESTRLFQIDEFEYEPDAVEDLLTTAIEELEASLESYHNSDLGALHLEMAVSLRPKLSDEELEEILGQEDSP